MEEQDKDCCEYCGEAGKLFKVKTYIGEREFWECVCKDCKISLESELKRSD